jgi:2-hydroxy-6-oxonona-2,4-dienedioate hydrolase
VRLPDGSSVASWHLPDGSGRPRDESTTPVVLVHGLGAAGVTQVPLAFELAAHTGVHVPDLPGYGRSPAGDGSAGPAASAQRLAGWARAHDLGPAIYLGVSAGCQVLLHLLATHPHLVDRAVLQGPTVQADARGRASQLARLLGDAPLEHPGLVVLQLAELARRGPQPFLRVAPDFLDDTPEALAPTVARPVLVVRGGLDPLVSADWARRLTALLPAGGLAELPRAPHALMYSRPRELAALTLGFAGHVPR